MDPSRPSTPLGGSQSTQFSSLAAPIGRSSTRGTVGTSRSAQGAQLPKPSTSPGARSIGHAAAERPEHRSAPKGVEVRRARSGGRCSTPMAMPVEDVEGWNRGFFCGVIGTSNRFLRGRSDGDPTWLAPLAALGGDGPGARHGMHIPKRARAQSEPAGGPGSRVAVRDLPGHPARASTGSRKRSRG